MSYVGRFAPSPTGPLHAGSLVAAVASFLDARKQGGQWLVRIEDLDPPREDPAAPAIILEQLRVHGLHWDGDVVYQSNRLDAYAEALTRLAPMTFRCDCSRKTAGQPYLGACRNKAAEEVKDPCAIRFIASGNEVAIEDASAGHHTWDPARDVGDFIIRRRDGLFAYQLAVVVDDAAAGVTHVVRGIDLLESTPRQVLLMRALGFPVPEYRHVPVVVGTDGHKLSKQTGAAAIPEDTPGKNLQIALAFLGMELPVARPAQLLEMAIEAWPGD